MDIKCPNCQTDISIPVEKVKQSESQVTCNNCDSVINLKSDMPETSNKVESDLDKMIDDALGRNRNITFRI